MDSYNSQKRADAFGLLDDNIAEKSNIVCFQFIIKTPFEISVTFNDASKIEPIENYVETFKTNFNDVFGKTVNQEFEYSTLSMFLSGLSLFTGPIMIQTTSGPQRLMNNTLLSFVPSKTFFPRGFLWDEGFHLQIACE